MVIWRSQHTNMGLADKNASMDSILAVKGNLPETVARSLAVTVAKSLDDSLKREVRGKESRVGLAMVEIKQSMAAFGCVPRWPPSQHDVA